MRTCIAAVLLLTILAGPAWAQSAGDDELFGDDLFGGALVRDVEEDPDARPADELLESAGVSLGGELTFRARLDADLDPGDEDHAVTSGLAELSARLFLDARPSSEVRVYIEGDAAYRTASGLDVELREMFVDLTVLDTVFLRAGKQTINWGVGLFYSPANLVNVERVDPEDSEAQLAGPVALKGQLPVGTSNLTGYLLLEDLEEGNAVGAAARYEFLIDDVEITAGATVQSEGPWAVMATATGAIEDVTVFAEAVVQGDSDKVFVVEDAASPTGYRTTTSDDVVVSGTVGGRYSYSSEDERFTVRVAAQYFLNGLGYDDPTLFSDDPTALAFALSQVDAGAMSSVDLLDRGRHNAAFRVESPDIAGTDLTPSLLWLASLSDGSGLLHADVRYAPLDEVAITFDYAHHYGPEGAEYSVAGPSHALGLELTVSGAF